MRFIARRPPSLRACPPTAPSRVQSADPVPNTSLVDRRDPPDGWRPADEPYAEDDETQGRGVHEHAGLPLTSHARRDDTGCRLLDEFPHCLLSCLLRVRRLPVRVYPADDRQVSEFRPFR